MNEPLTIQAYEVATGQSGTLSSWCKRGQQAGAVVRPCEDSGACLFWEEAIGRCCCITGIIPTRACVGAREQIESAFDSLRQALGDAGLMPEHLLRTWFVLDSIASTYDEFNRVRSQRFRDWRLDRRQMPASTAVGAANPWGVGIVAGALAVAPAREDVSVGAAASPMQCPAADYGSAFSRATTLYGRGSKRLFVSGTASIDPVGVTQHPFDEVAQFEQTLVVLSALLAENGFDWRSAINLTAYFKSAPPPGHVTRLCQLCPDTAVHAAVADICREDLCVEVEIELGFDDHLRGRSSYSE